MGVRVKPQTVGFGSSKQAERCINMIFRALKFDFFFFVLPNYSAHKKCQNKHRCALILCAVIFTQSLHINIPMEFPVVKEVHWL